MPIVPGLLGRVLTSLSALSGHDQRSGLSFARDQINGSQLNIENFYANHSVTQSSKLKLWMTKLANEVEKNERCQATLQNLQFFHKRFSVDGVWGLEDKLHHAGRGNQIILALMQKEEFEKLLERYSLYQSAQQIFAHCLAKANHEFNYFIHPHVNKLSIEEIDRMVTTAIVEPLVNECHDGVFTIDYNIAMGMVYWLSEQCFVRWHQ